MTRYHVVTYIDIPPLWIPETKAGGRRRISTKRILFYSSPDRVKAVTFRIRLEIEHPTMKFQVEEKS